MSVETRVRELLAPLTAALEADGYGLEVEVRPDLISLRVTAGPGACDDCLVPREMMAQMFRSRLPPGATGLDHDNVELTYPPGA